MGLCQLERLRGAGIPEHQIDAVIEIARHIRDEAAEKVDTIFDEKAQTTRPTVKTETTSCCGSAIPEPVVVESCGCTPTPGGQSCC